MEEYTSSALLLGFEFKLSLGVGSEDPKIPPEGGTTYPPKMREMLKNLACLFCLLTVAYAEQGTGSISGRVTVQGKPLVGIVLGLQSQAAAGTFPSLAVSRAETDSEGNYQFRGVAPGSYQITVLSPLFVLPQQDRFAPMPSITIMISEGENVTNADLSLIRGGVVTGKVVDAEGRPLIEHFVQLDRRDERGNFTPTSMNRGQYSTDDRGIYRIIGVTPGRYRASAGEGEGSIRRMQGGKSYPRTFHPDTTEVSQAKIIEVSEGSEVTGVDIQLNPPVKTYTIVGRAVDAETNEPVANLGILYSAILSNGSFVGMGGGSETNANGEFRIDSVRSGRYGVYAASRMVPQPVNARYSDPVPVDVVDGDATGVEIRVKRGGSISGVLTVEGVTDQAILAGLSQQRITVYVETREYIPVTPTFIKIANDGTFQADGLRPGKATFNPPLGAGMVLTLMRIERDGVRVAAIEIGPGEHVTGVRLVFAYGNGIVRGQVTIKGGALPEGTVFLVSARQGDESGRFPSVRSDVRGNFVLERLPPGQYEIVVQPLMQGAPMSRELYRSFASSAQKVTVANGQTVPVMFNIDLTSPEQKQ